MSHVVRAAVASAGVVLLTGCPSLDGFVGAGDDAAGDAREAGDAGRCDPASSYEEQNRACPGATCDGKTGSCMPRVPCNASEECTGGYVCQTFCYRNCADDVTGLPDDCWCQPGFVCAADRTCQPGARDASTCD